MADTISALQRSANMRAIRSINSQPEMIVRRLTHAMGYRFRIHRKDLPGKPDMVFPKRKAVIFVHGCFWHQHEDPNCKKSVLPKSNADYWQPKLIGNKIRDAANESALRKLGWEVLVIWECQVKDMESLKRQLKAFLN